ncbi:MAG: DEAD/DEAH box helicase family protein, partial [Cyclobacteriaceae bacterium]
MSNVLSQFPSGIRFKYPWRTYQQRVLDELESHLSYNHLHVIAPPGSGKTVLGLEVMLRLNKPTLILAPTRAIRNQWIDRFCTLFLQTNQKPDWISDTIKDPQFITVSTYQGLHAACTGTEELIESEEDEDESPEGVYIEANLREVISALQNQGLGTIVIDEAHHLKNAWWQSIIKIKNHLSPVIVGLTATPPYDVTYAEWTRYIDLNGPVDTEISVPELIKEGDLCPHQDYVLISNPTEEELTH